MSAAVLQDCGEQQYNKSMQSDSFVLVTQVTLQQAADHRDLLRPQDWPPLPEEHL